MREIKFRGWSEGVKRMTYFGDGTGLITNSELKEGDVWGMFFKAQGDGCVYLTGYQAVMQYTGLKDKKGTEIYEGDVLHILEINDTKEAEYNAVVKWEDYAFIIKPTDDTNCDALLALCSKDNIRPLVDWEVIGNIYENPELLEG